MMKEIEIFEKWKKVSINYKIFEIQCGKMKTCFLLLLFLNVCFSLSLENEETKTVKLFIRTLSYIFNCDWFSCQDCTGVSRSEEPLLALSTLSGKLYAIDPSDGETRWISDNGEATVKANTNINDYTNAVYLPDPSNGNLYKLQSNGDNGNELKKLP